MAPGLGSGTGIEEWWGAFEVFMSLYLIGCESEENERINNVLLIYYQNYVLLLEQTFRIPNLSLCLGCISQPI